MGAGIGAITKLGMEAENSAIAFEVLLGSGEKASKMLAEITEMGAKTPFEKMDLQNAAQTMLNFGVAEEKVLEYMQQLGDIAAGDKQKFQSLALVFGQVSSAGNLSGQDLLQFITAGFNPLKELQSMTGKTYAELQDAMSKGKITADMVAAAMKRATSEGGKFFGMMDKMSATTAGRISTVIDSIKERTAKMFEYIAPLIARTLEIVDAIIPPMFAAFEVVLDAIREVVRWIMKYQEVLKYVGIAVATFYTIIQAKTIALYALVGVIKIVTAVTQAWATVTKVLNALFVSSPIGWIALAIGGLAAAVVYCWDKFEGFRSFILGMWDTLKQFGQIIWEYVVSRFYEAINGVKNLALAFKKFFSGDYSGAYDALKGGISQFYGVQSGINAVNNASKVSFSENYNRRKDEQSMVIPANATTGTNDKGLKVSGLSGNGKGSSGTESLGISGTGSGKGVTLTVHMTNNFNLSGEGDVKRIVERVKQELVTVLTDVVPA
jgi:tape measure domain-containing protein